MCTLQIFMQCYDRFYEIALDENEKAELFVEEMIAHVLVNLFGNAIVDDVSIQRTSGSPVRLHHCSLSIQAQCSCEEFVLYPRSQEYMKQALEQGISSIFKELSIEVKFDKVLLHPSRWQCRRNSTLSYSN